MCCAISIAGASWRWCWAHLVSIEDCVFRVQRIMEARLLVFDVARIAMCEKDARNAPDPGLFDDICMQLNGMWIKSTIKKHI